jgi:hypothetical protein
VTPRVVTLISGLVIGAASAWRLTEILGRKKYQKDFDQELEVISEKIRLDYAHFYSAPLKPEIGDLSKPVSAKVESLVAKIGDAPIGEKLIKGAKAHQEKIIQEMNYSELEETVSEPDLQENLDISNRNKDAPYLITTEEFMNSPFDSLTLRYFERDDTLIEEPSESPIEIEDTIGSDVLTEFGHNLRDKDVIHVCNERLEAVYEVTRDRRSYSKVVLGLDDDEDTRPQRKMRPEDD